MLHLVRSKSSCAKITIALFAIFLFHFSYAHAETSDELQEEFDELCSYVEAAPEDVEELKVLIERVDKLMPKLESSDHPKKKVLIFRLKKCRSFFEYMIDLQGR